MKAKSILLLVFLLAFLSPCSILLAQQEERVKITGVVTDELGGPIIGASIIDEGTKKGTITDTDGQFSLEVSSQTTLRIVYIGYETQFVKIGSKKSLKVVLKEDTKILDEVVVTAMGINRQAKALSYARQSVDTETMTEIRDANLLNMLAGKVSGVQLISGGGPLSSTRVVIRGNNSLTGNNQPLYVVDGVPIRNEMGESGDLDYGNAANNINPDDIESMEVLKGANASALYGSDAANGVILITTKKGSSKGGLGVSYGFNLALTSLYQYPNYQNIYGVGNFSRWHNGFNYYNVQGNNPYNPENPYGIFDMNIAGYDQRSWGLPMLGFDIVGRNGVIRTYNPSPETVSDMYKTGTTMTHSFAIDKVMDQASIRFSYTNIHADDILTNFNKLDRHSFGLRSTAILSDFLDLDAGVKYNYENVDNRGYRNASDRNPLYVIANLPRDATISELTPWKNPDGTALSRKGFNNPYWLLNELSNADNSHWLLANVGLNFKFGKNFGLRVKAATDVQTKRSWRFDNYYSPFDLDGSYEVAQETTINNNYDGIFTFDYNLTDKVRIGSNAGVSEQYLRSNRQWSKADILLQPKIKSLSNNAGTLLTNETYWGKEKQAVFAAANVGYDNWLFVEGTARNEWSSTLPKDNNSYFYYSFGTSLVVTDMLKMTSPILSFAKIRGSFAQVGNDTGFDRLFNGYSYGGIFLGDMPYYNSDRTRNNSGLKPEKTISSEVGLDLRLFNGRVSLDATYYNKSTKNQIITADISKISGYGNKVFNSGEIQNWGVELTLGLTPVKLKDFEWNSNFNWAVNRSKVVSLVEGVNRFQMDVSEYDTKLYVEVGKPYGVIYGNDYRRNEKGQILVSLNGAPLSDTDKYLGTVEPDFIGGWRNTFKYKAFDFGFTLDFKQGGIIFSRTAVRAGIDGQTIQSLEGREEDLFSDLILGESDSERRGFMEDRYTVLPGANYADKAVLYPDGRQKGVYLDNTVYGPDVEYWAGQPSLAWLRPMEHWTHNSGSSMRRYIYDASFIKLREINLGYTVPPVWLRKHTPFKTARISAVGRNVAILLQHTPKGIDPEATSSVGNAQGFEKGYSLPSATWGFDLKVSF